jgi:hypothetical protein
MLTSTKQQHSRRIDEGGTGSSRRLSATIAACCSQALRARHSVRAAPRAARFALIRIVAVKAGFRRVASRYAGGQGLPTIGKLHDAFVRPRRPEGGDFLKVELGRAQRRLGPVRRAELAHDLPHMHLHG